MTDADMGAEPSELDMLTDVQRREIEEAYQDRRAQQVADNEGMAIYHPPIRKLGANAA